MVEHSTTGHEIEGSSPSSGCLEVYGLNIDERHVSSQGCCHYIITTDLIYFKSKTVPIGQRQ